MKKTLKKYMRSLLTVLVVLVLSVVLNFFDFGGDQQTSDNKDSEVRTEAAVPTERPDDVDERATAAETEAETELPEPDTETEETKSQETPETESDIWGTESPELYIDPDGVYTSMEDVALYIYLYGELPDNFMTKSEARKLGWEGGSLEPFAPGMCIGGDRFGNYEGLLPEAKGRTYKECDIDTLYASSRGAKRIVFSNDGLIYYTEDHYESFELIYPEED